MLAALLGTAFFSARGAVELVAGALLGAPARLAADGGALEDAAFELWRDRRGDATALLLRNVFDSRLGSMSYDAAPAAAVPSPARPTPAGTPEAPHAPCAAPIRLVASWVPRDRPERSLASLGASAAAPRLYGPGAIVEGHTVLRIDVDRVVLESPGASVCDVAMFSERTARRALPEGDGVPRLDAVPRASTAPPRVTDPSRITAAELDASVTATGPTSWTLRRTLVDRLLADQVGLLSLARVAPHEAEGRIDGVMVYGVPRDGLLSRLGVRTGDVLRTVNGFALASAEEGLAAYVAFRSADRISVALLRGGVPVTLDYSIE